MRSRLIIGLPFLVFAVAFGVVVLIGKARVEKSYTTSSQLQSPETIQARWRGFASATALKYTISSPDTDFATQGEAEFQYIPSFAVSHYHVQWRYLK